LLGALSAVVTRALFSLKHHLHQSGHARLNLDLRLLLPVTANLLITALRCQPGLAGAGPLGPTGAVVRPARPASVFQITSPLSAAVFVHSSEKPRPLSLLGGVLTLARVALVVVR
jgi:hypothetical protein